MLHGKSVIAVPPGATIREQLEIRGMSQREFAKRMGMTEKHISHLINGKVELSQDVALRLESVLGVPAKFWNNLEAIYSEKVARATAENELEEDILIAKEFPYSKMATLGWVPPTRKAEEKVMNKVLLSSKKMDWCTPVDFFNKLNKKFHFVLDPAATDKTAKCPLYYTPETEVLTRNKHGRICVDGCRLRPLHAPGRKREAEGRAGAGSAGL